ncbi:hypothetical protein [Nostoc sp.]|uniref:hypothetical protein n=1 Tax=Nostoc sp. TaxID=1180 RepID=UPI002FFAC3E6
MMQVNQELQQALEELQVVKEKLHQAYEELEQRVAERTAELVMSNVLLQQEIIRHLRNRTVLW